MPVNDVSLTRRRQELLARLRETTATGLARRWSSLGSWTDAQHRQWARTATPLLEASQRRAIDLQIAHLQTLLGTRIRFDRDEILAAAAIDINEPFVALGRALAAGASIEDAVIAGRLRAEGIGESGVQWASRAANLAVDDERVVGWNRTLGAGSCDWCQQVSGQVYKSAESASFGHLRCSCGVDPIIGHRNPGAALNAQFKP